MSGFVVLEGIDGCGKSSVAKLLVKRIGKRAVFTREPTDSWIGKAVRRGDKRELSPYTDALLFMADRAQHTQEISKLLGKGRLVISDRYYHSTVAYQAACLKGIFKGDPFKWLLEANLKISLEPDLTIILDIPPKLGLKRIEGRSKLSRFERLAFLEQVRANYLKLARLDKTIVRIDASGDLESVTDAVLELVKERNL
ncbi:MAG: dTMP kinase [Euryarchaeota archaeon RBG_13_57_23]|nr:MAG: dTMP kinase [Euryarchaeota archaeon RBG_13_57_23]